MSRVATFSCHGIRVTWFKGAASYRLRGRYQLGLCGDVSGFRGARSTTTPNSSLNGTAPPSKGDTLGGSEKLVDISEILKEARQLSPDLIFEDFDPNEPAWEPPPPIEEILPPPAPEPEVVEPPPLPPSMNPLLFASAYSPEQGFKELTVHQVHSMVEAGEVALVLDVREPYELEEYGTVAGALNVPLSDVSAAVKSGRLDSFRSAPVVVICAHGIRSAQATVRLSKVLGFENVSNMQGGVHAWLDAGLPLQQHS